MAKTLPDFDFSPKGRGEAYPWNEWFDGRIYKLVQGEDFETSPLGFRSSIYNAAARHDVKVRTSVVDGGIVIQADPRPAKKAPAKQPARKPAAKKPAAKK